MPTPSRGPRMGGGPAHERLMLANLATQLFEHGRITTTVTKAKRLRPYAEHLITFGKRGDLHARRQVMRVIRDKSVVHTLFTEIGPAYEGRPGGYTRITKIGNRKGDNAPMAVIALVEGTTLAQQATSEGEAARGTTFAASKAPTGATAEAAADLATESEVAAGVAADAEEATTADVEAAAVAEATPIVDEPLVTDAVAEPAAGTETEDDAKA